MKKILLSSIFNFFFLFLFLFLSKPAWASGTLYFSPSSGTKYNGQNFTVSVRASGMDSVDGVKAVIIFPADKLTLVSMSSNGSAWGIQAQQTSGNGTAEFDRGNIGNLSGDQLVSYITFRPRTNAGSASLSFSSDSALTNAGSNVISGKGTASYTLADAPPPPAVDTTPPVISAVAVTNLSVNTAMVSWTTNEASDSNVDYGTSKDYFLTTGKADLVTSHSVALDSRFLVPGSTYHYMVRSKDASGNEAKGTDLTFDTLGYDIKVTITDENGKPLANSEATLHSSPQTVTTDQNGVATFKNVTVGDHVVTVVKDGLTLASTITVQNAGAKQIQVKDKQGNTVNEFQTAPQAFNVKLAAASNKFSLVQTVSLAIAGVLWGMLLGLGIFYLLQHRQNILPRLKKD